MGQHKGAIIVQVLSFPDDGPAAGLVRAVFGWVGDQRI
jgi:hypothetical protein